MQLHSMRSQKLKTYLLRLSLALAAALCSFGLVKIIVTKEQVSKDAHKQKIEDKESNFNNFIKRIKNTQNIAPLAQTISTWLKIDSSELTREKKRNLYLAIAENVNRYCEENPEEEDCSIYVIKYFYKAHEVSDLAEDKKKLNRRLAGILIKEGKWFEAERMFAKTESYLVTPENRWKSNLHWANCLVHLEQYGEAIEKFTSVIDESDLEDIWAQSVRAKAELLFKVANDTEKRTKLKTNLSVNDSDEQFREKLLNESKELFEKLIDQLAPIHQERIQAELGLLQILVDNQEFNLGYKLANQFLSGPATNKDKANCLFLLSELEEKSRNPEKAVSVLKRIIERYSEDKDLDSTLHRICRILEDLEMWDQEFSILENMASTIRNGNVGVSILKKFFPTPGGLLTNMSLSNPNLNYKKRLIKMVHKIRRLETETPKELFDTAKFLDCVIPFYSGDYAKTEKRLLNYFSEVKESESLEMAHYLDMMTSIKLGKLPVVKALRANRYLHPYPNGAHSHDAYMILLNAYYDVGAFSASLDIAKKSYVKEIAIMGAKNQFTYNSQWMSSLAKMGQCYVQLGDYDQADQIFRSYASQFLSFKYGVDAYISWINVARAEGQNFEAIRRYDTVLPKIEETTKKIQVQVARDVLALQVEYPKANEALRDTIKFINVSDDLSKELKEKPLRVAYEALLKESFFRPEDFDSIFTEIYAEFPNELWVVNWALQAIAQRYDSNSLIQIENLHKDLFTRLSMEKGKQLKTYEFLKTQNNILESLIDIEAQSAGFEKRGLTL